MPIRVIDPICSLAILSMRVTLVPFRADMRRKSAFRNSNGALFCAELNGKSWWKFYVATIWFFKYTNEKLKICRFRKKLIFVKKTHSNFDLGAKNAPPISSTCRQQSAGFFPLSSTTLSFETHQESYHSPPPLHVRVMKSGVHGRGKKISFDHFGHFSSKFTYAIARRDEIREGTLYNGVEQKISLDTKPLSVSWPYIVRFSFAGNRCFGDIL